MRIVFVSTGTLATFGTTYRALGLGRQLVNLGVEVHLLLPGWRDNRLRLVGMGVDQGLQIHFTRRGTWSEMVSKYELLRDLRPEVIHCLDVVKRCFLPSWYYRRRNACRLILDMDEYVSRVFPFPRNVYAFFAEHLAIRSADSIIVVSRSLEDEFRAKADSRLLYLPNAVDLEHFERCREGWEAVRGQWPQRKIVSYLGSLYPRFDVDLVLQAAIRILEKRRDIAFVMLGTGPLLEPFRRKTVELSLQEHIRWYGFVPDEDVPKYLAASDALVFPIRDNLANRARCPGKTYHYIAAGVPIVTNPVGEVREALGDRGWYFKDGSVEDFCRVLEQCLEAGPKSNGFGDSALAERHSWRRRAETYLQFLQGPN